MLTASHWQWQRYLYKRDLVATYNAHSVTLPKNFPADGNTLADYTDVLHQKVEIAGQYDFIFGSGTCENHTLIGIDQRHTLFAKRAEVNFF